MKRLTLTFLGQFEALLDDKPLVHFRSAKTQALFIYLVMNSQAAQSRSGLAALLWPTDTEPVAKQNLRQAIFRLRQLLGDGKEAENPYLLVTRASVQFNPASDFQLDVTAFHNHLEKDQLEEAAALYRDELLVGFSCDSLPFDSWLRQEREKVHRLALETLTTLAGRSLARADYQETRRLARRQLAREPWREEAHRQLMQALALQGDRSAALAQYSQCVTILEEELGIEPSQETKTLAAFIRDRAPQPANTADSRPGQPRLTIPFAGRQAEFKSLVQRHQLATQNSLQVISLIGTAGVGKTRLAQQFMTWVATQGADILMGRAIETSAGLSYLPVTQLFRPRIEQENAPEDLLSDLWLAELARLLPELRERYPDLPPPHQFKRTRSRNITSLKRLPVWVRRWPSAGRCSSLSMMYSGPMGRRLRCCSMP